MLIFNIFKKQKEEKQTTSCYCPRCGNELIHSESLVSDDELVTYECCCCGLATKWLFDAPVPILVAAINL